MRRVMADPNPSAKMERKTQRRPAEIKPRIIERRGKKGGLAPHLPPSPSLPRCCWGGSAVGCGAARRRALLGFLLVSSNKGEISFFKVVYLHREYQPLGARSLISFSCEVATKSQEEEGKP